MHRSLLLLRDSHEDAVASLEQLKTRGTFPYVFFVFIITSLERGECEDPPDTRHVVPVCLSPAPALSPSYFALYTAQNA